MFRASRSIVGAVRANGMYSPVKISGFSHDFQLSGFTTQPLLVPTDINTTNLDPLGEHYSSSHESLVENLLFWVALIQRPAHLFLISSDTRLATTLHELRKRNYNVLVASNLDPSSAVLCLDSSIAWRWDDLVKGDKLIGMYLNQPPDESLYRHYDVPLESVFSAVEPWRPDSSSRMASKKVERGGFLEKVRRMWFGPLFWFCFMGVFGMIVWFLVKFLALRTIVFARILGCEVATFQVSTWPWSKVIIRGVHFSRFPLNLIRK